MMKRRLTWLFLAVCLVLAFSAMAIACGEEEKKPAPVVEATGITLNKTALSLEVDGGTGLVAKLTPANANAKITWTSSDNNVVTVTNLGFVKAIDQGTATITATVSGKTATCEVTVAPPIYYLRGVNKADKFNWDQVTATNLATYQGVLVQDATNKKLYTIEIDLYKDDKIKIGKVATANWGYQIAAPADATDDQEQLFTISSAAVDTEYKELTIAAHTSGDPQAIKVGTDGKYLISVDFTAGVNNPVVKYKRTGDAEDINVVYDWYLIGSASTLNWVETKTKEEYQTAGVLFSNETDGSHKLTLAVTSLTKKAIVDGEEKDVAADELKFNVVAQAWKYAMGSGAYGGSDKTTQTHLDLGSDNIKIKDLGTYEFTISADNRSWTYTYTAPSAE